MRQIKKDNNLIFLVFVIFLIFFMLFILFQLKIGYASGSYEGVNTSLSIWDDTDSSDRYTYNTNCNLGWKTQSYWNVYFSVNYTKKDTAEAINYSYGNCTLRFDENNSGSYTDWKNMTYNETSGLWEYNRSFTAKGLLDWEANCTTNLVYYENLSVGDTAEIKNSEPCIFGKGPGGNLPNSSCYEDSVCYYNFSTNCSDDDLNDILDYNLYEINNQSSSNFPWFSINTSTGMIKTNATTDSNTGDFDLDLIVGDTPIEGTGTASSIATLPITVVAVNDIPFFTALPGITENATEEQWFNFTVTASDEENDVPFYFNLSFINNCSLANWSSRINCTLFEINHSSGKISFLPSNDDVGIFWINFTVKDSGSPNQTNLTLVMFEVINVNDAPLFVYACDNETNATEDISFNCWINATDVDENQSLNFTSNYSWFTFNNSQTNISIVTDNESASALINFTPNDTAVGNFSIKIIAIDTEGASNFTIILFNVSNVQDNPKIPSIANKTCYKDIVCEKYINSSDDDLLIPIEGKGIFNESLNFSSNITFFNITKVSESYNGSSNVAIGIINFTPTQGDIATHLINISVIDNSSLINSTVFILIIENNTIPEWNESKNYSFNLTEDTNFFLNISNYTTDPDNDVITFYSNPPNFPSFNLTESGIINFTPADADVNFHYFNITVSDGKGNSSHLFNFNVTNINDAPILSNIQNITTEENNQTLIYFYGRDDDLLIQNKNIFNESLNFSRDIINLTGDYRGLFDITTLNITTNKTWALINFTPVQEDIGNYTAIINVSDNSSLKDSVSFNISITDINNTPSLDNIGNQVAGVNIPFTMNISAIDQDNDTLIFYSNTSWFTFNNSQTSITVIPQNKIANATISFTPLGANSGTHKIKINASDDNSNNSDTFDIRIYDQPSIIGMNCYNVSENGTFYCTGIISQGVSGDINCTLTLTNSSLGNKSNATSCTVGNFNVSFKTNFTDEGIYDVELNVSNPFFSSTSSKLTNISHSNAPPKFLTDINDIEISGTSSDINISNNFYDADHWDVKYNQTINFTWAQFNNRTACESNGANVSVFSISVGSPDNYSYITSISSSASASAIVKIWATDSENSNYNVSSNCFLVSFTVSPPIIEAVSSGGGSGASKPVTIKISTPEPISLDSLGTITVPIQIENIGESSISSITLGASSKRKDVTFKLSKEEISSLSVNQKENINLEIKAKAPDVIDIEPLEVNIFAEAKTPKVSASAKFLVNLIEHNREERLKAEEKKKILEELITSNPECMDLKESLEKITEAFNQRDYIEAIEISEDAIQACKNLISGEISLSTPKKEKWPILVFVLIFFTIILFILILSSYYIFKMKKFK